GRHAARARGAASGKHPQVAGIRIPSMFGTKTTPALEPPRPAVVPGAAGGPGLAEPDVHVLDRLHVLYKYRRVMISVTLLVLIAGIVQTYTTTPAYQATIQVRAEPATSQTQAVQQ